MMFTDVQIKELTAPLSSAHVKERAQSGRKLSYIEGWHAIAEANRIFGFDGWTRETVETRLVMERERPIGQQRETGWGVSYVAKVRVTVGSIIRDGVGTGHGIDRDLGLAHESAIKEAETDAMKRALMTFGNPFGLALYDKTQANVADEPAPQARQAGAGAARPPERAPAPANSTALELIKIQLRECTTPAGVDEFMSRNEENRARTMNEAEQAETIRLAAEMRAYLVKREAKRAAA